MRWLGRSKCPRRRRPTPRGRTWGPSRPSSMRRTTGRRSTRGLWPAIQSGARWSIRRRVPGGASARCSGRWPRRPWFGGVGAAPVGRPHLPRPCHIACPGTGRTPTQWRCRPNASGTAPLSGGRTTGSGRPTTWRPPPRGTPTRNRRFGRRSSLGTATRSTSRIPNGWPGWGFVCSAPGNSCAPYARWPGRPPGPAPVGPPRRSQDGGPGR